MSTLRYAVPIRRLIAESAFPTDFITASNSPLAPVLDRLFFTDYALINSLDGAGLVIHLVVAGEAALSFPGVEGLALVLGTTDAGSTLIDAGFFASAKGLSARLNDVTVALRFPPSILKPVPESPGATAPPYAQIEVHGTIRLDESFNVHFEGFDSFSLKPVMIGNTGIIISAEDVKLDLSRTGTLPEVAAAGFDESFMGVYIGEATVKLPDDFPALAPADLVLKKCVIGSGGVSGRLEAHYSPVYNSTTKTFTGNGAGALFGIPFGLKDIDLEFKQNSFQKSEIKGELLLPFFDEPVAVDIGIAVDGGFTVALTSTGPNGLFKLTKPDILEIELDSIGFELKDGVFIAKLSGQITPLFGKDQGLNWPGFKVEELSIDSKGHVHLQGGWLALREQYNLDFHGFHVGITKIGFGKTEDDGKWVGFSGELKLVDGFTAGASVEGLRVTWYDDGRQTKVSFNGIGVEFEIPDVLYFKGDVAYRELEVAGQAVRLFDGDITLSLISLGLEIDAKLVVGSASGGPQGNYNFFAIYLGVELPTGIPLSPTPLALFGLAGLFALQMEPNKAPDEEWYEDWFKRPETGVTDLKSKWVNRRGSMALGFGGTFGTYSDDGFTVAVKALLVLVFPGPIILLTGRANLLKERAKLSDEAMFEALAVLDMREGQILMGLAAKYKQDEQTGKVIAIEAGAEAFFHNPGDWHLYMGEKEPRSKRIRARILSLFDANSYFMIDPKQLATGAWVGYAKQWKFGPVGLTLEAWIEGNVVVNWTPLHFCGDLWLHGNVEVSVFGFGLSLSVDARFAADVFDPFHVVASFEFSFRPPKPFKKEKHVEITLEWGPQKVWPALLPLPLKEVAIEHFKVTTSWPLPKDGKDGAPPLLGPKYDFEKEGLRNYDSSAPSFSEPPLAALPVVPLDCRPHITFGRPVNDDALIGVNPQPAVPTWERIGDPAKDVGPVRVRYGLKQVELFKWDEQAQQWRTVAVAGRPLNSGERKLFGSWAPIPQLPSGVGQGAVANNKLWLWSKTPFDYTRHGGSGVDDWFVANFPTYPCVPQDIPDREVCLDFERLARSQILETPWRSPDHPEITLVWPSRAPQRVTVLDPPVNGFTRALCFPVPPAPLTNSVMLELSAPAKQVKLWFVEKKKDSKVCVDFRKRQPRNVNLPIEEPGVTLGSGGVTNISAVPTTLGDWLGLKLPFSTPGTPQVGMNIVLARAATVVELMLSYLSPVAVEKNIVVAAFNSSGVQVDSRVMLNPQRQPEIVRFEGEDLKQIKISSPRGIIYLHELCFLCPDTTPSVTATGFDVEKRPAGTIETRGNEITISGENLAQVQLNGKGELCLLKICALLAPDPVEVAQREEMAAHLNSEVARWQDEGEVLEPFSAYRLTISTRIDAEAPDLNPNTRDLTQVEHAYFRTEGPPGLTKLSLPPGRESRDADKFDSGLEDLTRYVLQTTPATVPSVGEKPVMAKPFYRAYDIGVAFNEDYVDLMYRISGRDLGLYVFDSNNRPARDAEGRLLVQGGDWGAVEELTLTEGEQRWLALSNAENRCLPVISTDTITHDKKLTSAIEGRVLEADMIHEARLIPLLLREGFQGFATGAAAPGPSGQLGRWKVRDEGNTNSPSQWKVDETISPVSKYLTQTSSIKGGNDDAIDPVKPGTMLLFGNDQGLDSTHPEQPTNWTDYRFSVYLSATGGGAMGVVFRYQDGNNYYRFSMDHNLNYRRLISVANGIHTVLKEDNFSYELAKDYLITIEAIGGTLRVYQDGTPIFDVTDAAHAQGCIGLYCYDNAGARFNDVRIDDFRRTAPVVYRFQFTTSRFANFFHHLHSYQDETWHVSVKSAPDALAAISKAQPPSTQLTDNESRAYETLVNTVLGPAARQNPPEVQVTRVELPGMPQAFLVRSPEPIDWLRTEVALSRTALSRTEPVLPGKAKVAAVNFAANRIDVDSVVVLLREPINLTGYRIESRLVTWPVNLQSGVVIDARTLSADELSQQAAWTTYREFGTVGNLAAGTMVLTPDAATAPGQLTGVDAMKVDFASRIVYSVEVRLVGPDGVVVHARHFLPDDDYVSEDLNVLRKADGTGFFIFNADIVSGGTPFSTSQYRLKLTYRRNNKARVSTSQILSQAGDDADEMVTLDIPLQTVSESLQE